jgi:DNA ligase 1
LKLSELADYFEELDGLASRNAMIDKLASLFKASGDPEELRRIVYLLEGIMLPPYEVANIGISEQFMARAIAEATGVDIDKVRDLFRDIGDYGSVAEELITWRGDRLSVLDAYNSLLELTGISGKGSVEARVSGLAALIRRMGPKEARYILRVPIGKLRLGIGDPTIMDALSCAYAGDRSLRPVIERAYDVSADMGRVACILWLEGPKRLKSFQVRIGIPIRVELAERSETIEGILKRLGKCAIEPKYDGFRCQVHKDGDTVSIFTRNLENATAMFPDVVQATLRQIKAKQAIFEGEAVSYDPETREFHPFQVTVTRKRKHLVEVKEEELPLKLMAFDCLYRDGETILYEPYVERRQVLQEIISPDFTIQITDAIITDDVDEAVTFFNAMLTAGLEGIMAKNLDSSYMAGCRTYDWIKFKRSYEGKLRDTVDCAIVGYFAGRGKRAAWGIGSILCAVYNKELDRFETITRVASGLSDQGWRDMKAALDEVRAEEKPARVESLYNPSVWVKPTYVTEVLADEITRSPNHTAGRDGGKTGYALRFPRIVIAFRADRAPEDATTVDEIKEMYRLQHEVSAKQKAA